VSGLSVASFCWSRGGSLGRGILEPFFDNRSFVAQVAGCDFDDRRQSCLSWSASERAHRHTRGKQLVDHDTPDAAAGSGDQDWMHAIFCPDGLPCLNLHNELTIANLAAATRSRKLMMPV